MRIGIICNPWLGGAGAVATELGIELAKRGHKVHFICFDIPFRLIGPWRKNVYYHQAEILEYPAFKAEPHTIALANKIYEVSTREKIQLLNAHYAGPNSIAMFLAQQMLARDGQKIKTIVTLHGTDVSILSDEPTLKDVIKFSLQAANGITTVSKNSAQQIKEKYGLKKSVKTIYNFVKLKPYKNSVREELRSIFAKKEEKIITHVSNFREIKRIKDVIEVFYRINKKLPSKLLLVGDGPDQRVAYKLAGKYDLVNRVHFMGIQTNVEKILSISDLFLLPSEKENFSLSALEAMSCGVPVITSNVGGMPEMISDDKTGFLCEVGDIETMAKKGVEILKDETKLKKIAIAAQNRVKENYSPEIIVPQYEEYYKKIIGSQKGV